MNVFEELMIARKFSFANGRIALLNSRVALSPAGIFSEYSLRINDSPEQVFNLYDSTKVSFARDFAAPVSKEFKFDVNSLIKWMVDLSSLAGWGALKFENLDKEKFTGVIVAKDSPVAVNLIGKVKTPVDHVLRGFMAGTGVVGFKQDIDVLEEQCIALGAENCRFVFRPAGSFIHSPEVHRQLGSRPIKKE